MLHCIPLRTQLEIIQIFCSCIVNEWEAQDLADEEGQEDECVDGLEGLDDNDQSLAMEDEELVSIMDFIFGNSAV